MTSPLSGGQIAALFADIGEDLRIPENGNSTLDLLTEIAVRRVEAADYAGITVGRPDADFATVAATHPLVNAVDRIQYELGTGPCVDAVVEDTTFNAADLRSDLRWPEFGRRCVEETGIVSMLSIRLYIEDDHKLIAGLNMYSHQPRAFDENSEAVAHLLATHGALAVGKATAEDKVRNLNRALETSREIGTAIGILMALEKVTRDQAFGLLRIASQNSHRKLVDVARDVIDTGSLPEPPARRHQPHVQ